MISPEYAAGFFDGEGCVNLTTVGRRKSIALRVYIVNTDLAVLNAFRFQFGGFLACRTIKRKWKPFRVLTLTGYAAVNFLKLIEPFSRVKTAQIRLALEFWEFAHSENRLRAIGRVGHGGTRIRTEETREREGQFVCEMKLLNRKGARCAAKRAA